MKKLVLILLTMVLLLISFPACSQSVQPVISSITTSTATETTEAESPTVTYPAAQVQEIKSEISRDSSPVVSQTDLATLVEGNNTFAFNLYQLLREENGNLFYSPYSISEALAMTYAGARGDTETGMAKAMSFLLSQDKLHTAFNQLDLLLQQRGQSAKGDTTEGFRLNVVNSIWGQQGHDFLPEYLDTPGTELWSRNAFNGFLRRPEGAIAAINKWVSDETNDKIKDLIASLDPQLVWC